MARAVQEGVLYYRGIRPIQEQHHQLTVSAESITTTGPRNRALGLKKVYTIGH